MVLIIPPVFFELYMTNSTKNFQLLSILLTFIFCGVIVGETVALSLVISISGPQILSKLYLVNGSLLFLLPPLFFKNIDRFNRGKLLSLQLLIVFVILCLYLIILNIIPENMRILSKILLYGIYPISYLTKITLFLTFWTLANDICYTQEAKKEFPKIAAFGFLGGLAGALLSRALLEIVSPKMIIGLWAFAYGIAFVIVKKIIVKYKKRLSPKEQILSSGKNSKGLLKEIKDVMSIKLVKLIAILYFLVFIGIFLTDYLFWKNCYHWFESSHKLASFQFSFYISHAIITIIGLLFITPFLITKYGFSRLLSFFPYALLIGSFLIIGLNIWTSESSIILIGFVVFQFVRYVIFENAFSPIYQMFFASISIKKRGRAKTIIEGFIKPSAIILAGLFLILFNNVNNNTNNILVIIFLLAIGMVWVVHLIRITYMNGIVNNLKEGYETEEILTEIGSHYDQKILFLMKEYSNSKDSDLRGLAVRILAQFGSKQALKIIISIYNNENDIKVKEMIASSLTNFYWYETKEFIEILLKEKQTRIRSNVIYSLNNMNCYWKWRLKDLIKTQLFENNIRVQIEAAQFLWQGNDKSEKNTVNAFLHSLLKSKNENKRSAGIYLASTLKPDNWENVLLCNLQSASKKVFIRCIEVIFKSASKKIKLETLRIVENLTRDRIAITGRIIQKTGKPAVDTIVAFFKEANNRRMIYEMVHALRTIRDVDASTVRKYNIDKETEDILSAWILEELHRIYLNAFVWYNYKIKIKIKDSNECAFLLESALMEQLLRVCEWALDTMALLESQGAVALGRKDLDLSEHAQRLDMVEIVESFGANKLKSLVVPILEFDSWQKIAKIGKQNFSFKNSVHYEIQFFFHSENAWICLCALYFYQKIQINKGVLEKEHSTILALRNSNYTYLSRAATSLLMEKTKNNQGNGVNSFNLLETVMFFKKTILFRNVPAEKLMALAEISTMVSYKKYDNVSQEEDISDHLYIIKSGSLKIVKEKNNVTAILSIIKTGEAYGEIGLFNQEPRSATAIANEDCEIYVIQRSALKKLLLNIPEIAFNFLEIFSKKLKKSSEELTRLNAIISDKNKKKEMLGIE